MKRILSLALALVLCLSLCACGGDDNCYDDTQFPTMKSVISEFSCEPTVSQANLYTQYSYAYTDDQLDDFTNYYTLYETHLSSQFEKVTHRRKLASTLSTQYSAYLDGAGNAIRLGFDYSEKCLNITIVAENKLESYIDMIHAEYSSEFNFN